MPKSRPSCLPRQASSATHSDTKVTTARSLVIAGLVALAASRRDSAGMSSPPADVSRPKSPSPFEEHAFTIFSSSLSSHVAAPALLECLAQVGSAEDGALFLEKFPAVEALPEEQREWVRRTLLACGFELRSDGALRASEEVLEKLRKEQNAARKRAHAEAAAARERILSNALRQLEQSCAANDKQQPLTLAQARRALSKFLAAFDGQPAVGPLLLGLAALLRAQAASPSGEGRRWLVDRAAILNGGDQFVKRAVPLLGQCGVRQGSGGASGDAEEAGQGASSDELTLQLADGTWTFGEMSALAAHVERKCARAAAGAGFGGRASGRVDAGASAYEPRALSSLGEWLGSVLSAWLTRWAP